MAHSLTSVWPHLAPGVYLHGKTSHPPFPLDEPDCVLFSRARHALVAGMTALGVGAGDRILMPAWHHGSEVQAVLATGATCDFYDVGVDLSPREAHLERLLGPGVVALHLTHFLGFPQDAQRWRRWCDEHGLLLIEDAAQAWLASRSGIPVGTHGDLAVWCLYKTVGLPDGAAVRCKAAIPGARLPGGTGSLETLRRHAAWLAQQVPIARHRAESIYDPVQDMAVGQSAGPTTATRRLLPRVVTPDIAERRRQNYRRWHQTLANWVPPPFADLTSGAVPMVFPIAVTDKAGVSASLRSVGIHALELWSIPHPAMEAGAFPRAAWLRSHVLGLPVHQGLRPHQLSAAIGAVTRLVGGGPAPRHGE